jgi:hypothetical protein
VREARAHQLLEDALLLVAHDAVGAHEREPLRLHPDAIIRSANASLNFGSMFQLSSTQTYERLPYL